MFSYCCIQDIEQTGTELQVILWKRIRICSLHAVFHRHCDSDKPNACCLSERLTCRGQSNMHQGDSDGIIPHPALHHRGKQEPAAEIGELHRQQVHWNNKHTMKTAVHPAVLLANQNEAIDRALLSHIHTEKLHIGITLPYNTEDLILSQYLRANWQTGS